MVGQFVRVCAMAEIEEGKTRVFNVKNQPVILAKVDGAIYALEGICSHDGGEFGDGERLINGQIECPRHGARFNIKTGEVGRMPAVVGIKSFETKADNGDVYIAIDD